MIGSNDDDDAGTRRLKAYWVGEGRAKWASDPHPWSTLNRLLRSHGVPKHMVDGLTTNIFKLANEPMPNSRQARLAALKPEHKAALRKAMKGE